jgi:hypothetical protein
MGYCLLALKTSFSGMVHFFFFAQVTDAHYSIRRVFY